MKLRQSIFGLIIVAALFLAACSAPAATPIATVDNSGYEIMVEEEAAGDMMDNENPADIMEKQDSEDMTEHDDAGEMMEADKSDVMMEKENLIRGWNCQTGLTCN